MSQNDPPTPGGQEPDRPLTDAELQRVARLVRRARLAAEREVEKKPADADVPGNAGEEPLNDVVTESS
jgi:hypothetical protein